MSFIDFITEVYDFYNISIIDEYNVSNVNSLIRMISSAKILREIIFAKK